MIISLARLSDQGITFAHQYKTDELDVSAHEFELVLPLLLTGRVARTGVELRVSGHLKAEVGEPCDRCLRAVQLAVDAPFDLLYAPVETGAGRQSELELHERDLELSFYENDLLDLDQLAREQLELNLPTRVLCGADCRGLCAQCGTDLNVEQCRCRKEMDPRWQALAELQAASHQDHQ